MKEKPQSFLLLLQRLLLGVSALTLCVSVAFRCGVPQPAWLAPWTLPVLLAAAVGYLTNAIAIMMLFKPFDLVGGTTGVRVFGKGFWRDGRWIALVTLGLWRQGVIPRHKRRLGEVLSVEIPRSLLRSEELSRELGERCRGLLTTHPELGERLEEAVRGYLRGHLAELSVLLAERLRPELPSLVGRMAASRMVRELLGAGISSWLSKESHRRLVAQKVLSELQAQIPHLRQPMKAAARDGIQHIIDAMPMLEMFAGLLGGAEGLAERIDWDAVERRLSERLTTEEMTARMMTRLESLGDEARDWLRREEAEEPFGEAAASVRDAISAMGDDGLKSALEQVLSAVAEDEQVWLWLRRTALPAVLAGACSWLDSEEGTRMLRSMLDLEGRIKAAVDAMDVRQFHEMVLRVVEQHLGTIQILGYVLGALAGLLLS
ncbi:MAG: DUF445 family protein [Oligosphaeraceae bacterium]